MNRFQTALLLLMAVACTAHNEKFAGNTIDIHSVQTEAGIVSGYFGKDSAVMIFKGIPYAAPPLNDLRWKAPAAPLTWDGVLHCDSFAPSAMQQTPAPFEMWSMEFMAPEKPLSEDCLYLNIWSPAKGSGEKLPVMVWIHGGAFHSGSGSVPLYDGEEIAKKGIVFITINYRLGIFGFFAHPELSAESPDYVSGNYGILDQIAALRWVKNNVASFGGNPENVTIAGQSAGAFSVHALVVSSKARDLFHRAIAQSGGMFRPADNGTDLPAAEKAGAALIKELNIASVNDLRKMPAEALLSKGGRWGAIVDGIVIPNAYKAFSDTMYNDVPVLTGWNADEFFFGKVLNARQYTDYAGKNFGDDAAEFLNVFPGSSDEEAAQSQVLFSVLNFGWQNYAWAHMQNKYGRCKSWLYYFSHVPPGLPDYGAFHSAEFGYALKTLQFWDRPFEPYDYQLSEMMSDYWVNFARNGDPNGEGLPQWVPYDQSGKKAMEFGDQVTQIDVPYQKQLNFLSRLKLGPDSLE